MMGAKRFPANCSKLKKKIEGINWFLIHAQGGPGEYETMSLIIFSNYDPDQTFVQCSR